MHPIRVESIMLWGSEDGHLTQEEIRDVVMPISSILHLLRHFQKVPTDWKERITQEGASEKRIQDELAQAGSLWNPEIAAIDTPEKVVEFSKKILLEAIQRGRTMKWIFRRGRAVCYSSHLITPTQKRSLLGTEEESMGTEGIIYLRDLPRDLIRDGTRKTSLESDPIFIKVAESISPRLTDRVVISLAREKSGEIRPWTIYPGIITPSLPAPGQLSEELSYNQAFWNEHALIKTKKEVLNGTNKEIQQ